MLSWPYMDHEGQKQHQSSFRDPAGFIFEHGGVIYRQISLDGADDYEFLMGSGLHKELVSAGLMVEHQEIKDVKQFGPNEKRYKVIKPTQIPFISYPYEWTFEQLRDAALLTLKIQEVALKHGMILKDASAYNIQFIGRHPVFIDTLSFWQYQKGETWQGYEQFCEHFFAPLALAAYSSPDVLRTLRVFINGIPLKLARNLLPQDAQEQIFSRNNLQDIPTLIENVKVIIEGITTPKNQHQHQKQPANRDEHEIVEQMVRSISPVPKIVWSLGGNYYGLAASLGAYIIAFDMDHAAVRDNYLKHNSHHKQLLPLVQDLANPTPALGWAHRERHSLEERGPADAVLALDILPYLAITNHAPFSTIAKYFAGIGRYLIINFASREDDEVAQLLASYTRNTFSGYNAENFESAFAKFFTQVDKKPVKDGHRVIYLYKAKV